MGPYIHANSGGAIGLKGSHGSPLQRRQMVSMALVLSGQGLQGCRGPPTSSGCPEEMLLMVGCHGCLILGQMPGRKRMGKSEPIRAELKEQGYSLPSTHGDWI